VGDLEKLFGKEYEALDIFGTLVKRAILITHTKDKALAIQKKFDSHLLLCAPMKLWLGVSQIINETFERNRTYAEKKYEKPEET